MRNFSALLAALGMLIGVSGIALAGGDMEGCSYSTQQAKNATDKVVKEQATPASTDNAAKVIVAQTAKSTQPAVEIKK